jgi:hypothetical protein
MQIDVSPLTNVTLASIVDCQMQPPHLAKAFVLDVCYANPSPTWRTQHGRP